MKILIAIPTYNEHRNINPLLDAIFSENLNSDILFIDDKSQDKTEMAIRDYKKKKSCIKLICRKNKMGVGSAHLRAFQYAYLKKYEYLITMDSDFTHNPKYIKKMIKLNKIHPVVIGSRHMKKDSIKSWPFFRKSLTHTAFFITKNFLNIGFDATSGFRSYNLKMINKNIFNNIKSPSYSFFVESSFVLSKELIVKNVPSHKFNYFATNVLKVS